LLAISLVDLLASRCPCSDSRSITAPYKSALYYYYYYYYYYYACTLCVWGWVGDTGNLVPVLIIIIIISYISSVS